MRQHHSPARSFVPSIAPFDFGTSASVCHKWDDRHETGGYEAYSLSIREGSFSDTELPPNNVLGNSVAASGHSRNSLLILGAKAFSVILAGRLPAAPTALDEVPHGRGPSY